MMKLSDWNRCMRYAQEKCEAATAETGCDFRARPYTMYDGSKGIYIQLFDEFGKFYTETPSGITDDPAEFIRAINSAVIDTKGKI